MQLSETLSELRSFSGIRQKQQIQTLSNALLEAYPCTDHPNGDDTAAIKTDIGYDLLATEGFLSAFVEKDPWFAGWCGVMVNVSDIAAMGGRPTAIVNTFWGRDDEQLDLIFQGMVAASKTFRVPIVGGHTNLNTPQTHLSVSILGRATKLLSSFAAEPDHALVAVVDLRGAFRAPFLNWNTATEAPVARLRGDLELMPYIAQNGLASAAKDVSQAGFLGTSLMLLESSGVGANIDLQNLPKPKGVDWHDWLRSFPSFGYLLTTPADRLDELLGLFNERDITAEHIGTITSHQKLEISYRNQQETFWDLSNEPFTGMRRRERSSHIIKPEVLQHSGPKSQSTLPSALRVTYA